MESGRRELKYETVIAEGGRVKFLEKHSRSVIIGFLSISS